MSDFPKKKVMFAVDGDLHEVTLWDVTTNSDGDVTGTYVSDELPGCEEKITIPYEHVIAIY